MRVVVTRSQLVNAPQERVFSLLSSPAALSLRPRCFAFETTTAPGFGRLYFVVRAEREGAWREVLSPREEVPGRTVSLSWPTALPRLYTLSAEPTGSRVTVTIRVSAPDRPGKNSESAAYWHKQLKSWLAEIGAAVEGRKPWPDTGMPQEMQRTFMARRSGKRPVTVSEEVLIDAPVDHVWEQICAPGTLCGQPGSALIGGHVPGTPLGQVGEMQYHVSDDGGALLYGAIGVVKALDARRSALFQSLGLGHYQTCHRLTPTPDGTRLQLEALLTAQTVIKAGTEPTTANLRRLANAYKTAIERPLADADSGADSG